MNNICISGQTPQPPKVLIQYLKAAWCLVLMNGWNIFWIIPTSLVSSKAKQWSRYANRWAILYMDCMPEFLIHTNIFIFSFFQHQPKLQIILQFHSVSSLTLKLPANIGMELHPSTRMEWNTNTDTNTSWTFIPNNT